MMIQEDGLIEVHVVVASCDGCGICVEQCPTDVFAVEDKKCQVVSLKDCMACRLCETICPHMAVTVTEQRG